jgi:hypothetical protein
MSLGIPFLLGLAANCSLGQMDNVSDDSYLFALIVITVENNIATQFDGQRNAIGLGLVRHYIFVSVRTVPLAVFHRNGVKGCDAYYFNFSWHDFSPILCEEAGLASVQGSRGPWEFSLQKLCEKAGLSECARKSSGSWEFSPLRSKSERTLSQILIGVNEGA